MTETAEQTPPATEARVNDLVLLRAGSPLGAGLYRVAEVPSSGAYLLASLESPESAHGVTIPQTRILAVIRTDPGA